MRKILVYLVVFFSGLISAQDAHILFNRMNMAVYNPGFIKETGALLPSGSYYYRIDLGDGTTQDGWLYISY